MPDLSTCLWFDDRAEEAAAFYVSVFPRSEITGVTHYGEGGRGTPGQVMTVDFVLDGRAFTALNGGPLFTFNESISFVIDCADQDEVDHYWSRLTEGGEESQCGWLKDRFGVSWQIVPDVLMTLLQDKDAEKARRVTEAMLGMKKLDIAALQAAYDGR